MMCPGQLMVCQGKVVEMLESSPESLSTKDFLTIGAGGGGNLALVRLSDLSSPFLTLFIVGRIV
jgi:hypothetical protein